MVSSTNHAYDLTVNNAAAGHYSLVVMTVIAVVVLPIVLLYQGWSFYVFRRRVAAPESAPPEPTGATLGGAGGTSSPQ
jgi:cytochrome bd-type quinol oxidase subunit 2